MSDSLFSTSYLPPIEQIHKMVAAENILIELNENYIKQSYRNRCYILTANGPQALIVPVLLGSFHKTAIKDIRIDYSKRWQQVHLRAIVAAYKNAPYFQYYFEEIEKVIMEGPEFLVDLNTKLLEILMKSIRLDKPVRFTESFVAPSGGPTDYRFNISPKIESDFVPPKYIQVFPYEHNIKGLSIIDLIFNNGPSSMELLSVQNKDQCPQQKRF